MPEEEPFFISRNGVVWACWLGGKPAMKLGPDTEVLAAMKQFVAEMGGGVLPEGESPSAAPPAPVAPSPRAPAPVATASRGKPTEESERLELRHDISILGRVRTGTGPRDVTVLDLSERGCRFQNKFGPLAEKMPLTIKLGPIGPIEATVRWCRGEYVGLEFNNPLYPSVLEHIREHFDLRG